MEMKMYLDVATAIQAIKLAQRWTTIRELVTKFSPKDLCYCLDYKETLSQHTKHGVNLRWTKLDKIQKV